MEIKINNFEPISIDVEIFESQHEELQTAIKEYKQKTPDLDELNNFANLYISKVGDSQVQHQQQHIQLNTVTKLKKRISSNTR